MLGRKGWMELRSFPFGQVDLRDLCFRMDFMEAISKEDGYPHYIDADLVHGEHGLFFMVETEIR
jgi:hypothetical protein